VLVITADALNERPPGISLNSFRAVIVLNPNKIKLRSDLAEFDPPKTCVLSGEYEMKRIDTLVQWLPLVPSEASASGARKLPNLQTWCTSRAQLLSQHLKHNGDYMNKEESESVQALLRQTRCLPEFAAACGMKDLPAVPALEKLIPDTTPKEFYDPEQARKLSQTHGKIAWMVAKHMKR
jgi:hypothetical protein